MEEHVNPWKQLSSKEIYANAWITVTEDQVLNPNGGKGIYGTLHFKNYALGIIPVDENRNTWLVGQYRYPLDEYSWEVPMGGGLRTIDIIQSAKRELKEETGLKANQWKELIKIHTSNSVTDEVGYVFMATELEEGTPEFEETEQLEIIKLPLREAIDWVLEGRITDSLSVAGLLRIEKEFNW